MQREPKKIDSLEVRIAPETKAAFMAACRADGLSASAVLRRCIERYIRSASRAPVDWRKELHMIVTGKSPYRRMIAASLGLGMAGLAAASIAVPAAAAADPRIAALFEWMDANHDGRVSAAEFDGATDRAPGLGALRLDIDTRTPPPPEGESRAALFGRLDGDGDGALSLKELAERATARTVATPGIAAADENGDGSLTEGELAAYLTAQRGAAGMGNASAGAGLMARGVIAERDRDGDGRVPVADIVR